MRIEFTTAELVQATLLFEQLYELADRPGPAGEEVVQTIARKNVEIVHRASEKRAMVCTYFGPGLLGLTCAFEPQQADRDERSK